jgi:hypothetical protein
VLPEAAFLLSLAGLNASLAGLAGLVAGLRRGTELRRVDLFRLREIVEFSFANVLLAVAPIPAAALLGSPAGAVRVGAAAAIALIVGGTVVLFRRHRRADIPAAAGWYVSVAALDVAALVAGAAAAVSGDIGAYEALLVLLLARPMLAFLLVLASFEAS